MATDWLRYANQGATRNQPINDQLLKALSFLPDMGLTMEVFSGGQPGKGSGLARVGSVRHDHGNAADVFFSRNGQRLDWANPNDLPVFQEIVRRGRAAGITGFGAGPGYMQPGSMHIGFGSPGVWGAGGRGANAPEWLRSAFNGAPAGSPPSSIAQMYAQAPAAPTAPVPANAPANSGASIPAEAVASLGAPAVGIPATPGNELGTLALMFMRNQQERRKQREDEQAAAEIRRAALFDTSSLYG